MKKAEQILDKHLTKMSWTKTVVKHGNLYNTLIDAINEALTITSVVGQSEQLCDHPRSERSYIGQNMLRCNKCGKEFS